MADDEKISRTVTLTPQTGRLKFMGNVPTIVAGTNIAPDWYRDASEQSKLTGRDAVRREIVFVACFLESYIYEWVQGELVQDIDHLLVEIPAYDKNGKPARVPSLLPKWERFPKIVFAKKGRPVPDLDLAELKTLVNYRDGLMHAKLSKMYIANENDLSRPEPSLFDLEKIPNGWALNVAVGLVRELHWQYGTPVAKYLA